MRPEPPISPMFMSTHSLSDWNCECMKMWRRCTVHIHFIRDWTMFDHHVLKGVMATVTRGMWTNLLSQQWSSPSLWWSLSPASRMTLNQFASGAQTPHLSFKHLRYLEDRYGNRLPLATTRYHYVPPCLRETHIEEKQARKRASWARPRQKRRTKKTTQRLTVTKWGPPVNTGSCSRRLWGFSSKNPGEDKYLGRGNGRVALRDCTLLTQQVSVYRRFVSSGYFWAARDAGRDRAACVCVCVCVRAVIQRDRLTRWRVVDLQPFIYFDAFSASTCKVLLLVNVAHWPFNFGLFNICNCKLTHIIAINVKLSGCVIV